MHKHHPQSEAEFVARFKMNHEVTGRGLEMTIHVPCPFCAAKNFIVHTILEPQKAYRKGGTCSECGRSMRVKKDLVVLERAPNGEACRVEERFSFLQTGGDESPPWARMPKEGS